MVITSSHNTAQASHSKRVTLLWREKHYLEGTGYRDIKANSC